MGKRKRFLSFILLVIVLICGTYVLYDSLPVPFVVGQGGRTCNKRVSVKKRVLVTGSAGFIGYHTATALHKAGHFVIGLDNFDSAYEIGLKRERERLLLAESGVEIIAMDLCDESRTLSTLNSYKITHVVHLAARAGVRSSLRVPALFVRNNIQCSVALFEACRRAKLVPKITYASSSSLYGRSKQVPFREDNRLRRISSVYGATKASVERMSAVYFHLYGLHSVGLRFFTVYGPLGRPDMAYFFFSRRIMNGEKVELFQDSTGREPARDFTYVGDIVRGILLAMDCGQAATVYNLGYGSPESVSTLVRHLEKSLGRKANIVHRKLPRADVPITYCDGELARKELGFEAAVPLSEGIKLWSSWFKSWKPREQPSKCSTPSSRCVITADTFSSIKKYMQRHLSDCVHVCVTVMFGGTNDVGDFPLEPPPKHCAVLITDRHVKGRPKRWSAHIVIPDAEIPCDSPQRSSRVIKLLIHRWFPEALEWVYVDAKLHLRGDPWKFFEPYNSSLITAFKHPRRKNAREELKEVRRVRLDDPALFDSWENFVQINPLGVEEVHLIDGAIHRRKRSAAVISFNELWWAYYSQFSRRDQLSFGYALGNTAGFTSENVALLPNARFNDLVAKVPHKHTAGRQWC
jgi:UDP-glucuronate 4-epimerase